MPPADDRRVARLTRWFAAHARDLPWRRRRSGYRALVAEAMLQQTQVDRVVDAYRTFMRRFPTVAALAAADEQDVLACWRGLGYYRRARHLHAAAKMIVAEHGGRVPRDVDTLMTLPGVGRYTAGAIASIVYDRPVPIVDGNVQRVVARWDGFDGPAADPVTIKRAWTRAEELVAVAESPGAFNEAMMELGATVCTPRNPRCARCPTSADCVAFATGRQDTIPPPKPAARQKAVHHHAVIVIRRGRVLLEQRETGGMWAMLWQPPTIESGGPLEPHAITDAFADRGLVVSDLTHAGSMPFQTTHRRISFGVYTATTRARVGRWEPLETLDGVPMSAAHRRVLERFGR